MRRSPPICWSCDAEASPEVVEVESVIQTRSETDGGPFRMYPCPQCRAQNGVLSAPKLGWLFYPLEGRGGPSATDWIGSRSERGQRKRAQGWWQAHEVDVERFQHLASKNPRRRARASPQQRARSARAPAADPGPSHRRRRTSPPPPESGPTHDESSPHGATSGEPSRKASTRAGPSKKTGSSTGRKRAESSPAAPDSPHGILGVPLDADLDTVRRAYRAAVKKCHPDRVAHLDAEFQELAHRKVKALRRAYDALVKRLSN